MSSSWILYVNYEFCKEEFCFFDLTNMNMVTIVSKQKQNKINVVIKVKVQ